MRQWVTDAVARWPETRRGEWADRAAALERSGLTPSQATIVAWAERHEYSEPVVLNRHHLPTSRRDWPDTAVYAGRPSVFGNPYARGVNVPGLRGIMESQGWPQAAIDSAAATFHRKRLGVLGLYRRYVARELRRGGPLKVELQQLPAATALVCSCVRTCPLAPTGDVKADDLECHAQVLVRAWRYLHRGERG